MTAATSATSATSTPTTYRVVATGDSILGMSYGVASPGAAPIWVSGDFLLDAEYGRNAYAAGLAGRASTASMWPLVLGRSEPGGWIIIQDNALGVSDAGWSNLVWKIALEAPDDRCLLGVLPGYVAANDPTAGAAQRAQDTGRRATLMGQAFMSHPCRRFVYLNRYMLDNPDRFPDGQHPDEVAQAWIRSAIKSHTG